MLIYTHFDFLITTKNDYNEKLITEYTSYNTKSYNLKICVVILEHMFLLIHLNNAY